MMQHGLGKGVLSGGIGARVCLCLIRSTPRSHLSGKSCLTIAVLTVTPSHQYIVAVANGIPRLRHKITNSVTNLDISR